MRPPQAFGERIRNIELAYGSQRKTAAALGVSERTLRRWKNRRSPIPPTSHGTVFKPAVIKAREYYVGTVRPRREMAKIDRDLVDLTGEVADRGRFNSYMGRTTQLLELAHFSDKPGNEARQVFDRLPPKKGAYELHIDVVKIGPGGRKSDTELWVPSAAHMPHYLEKGGEVQTFWLKFESFEDLINELYEIQHRYYGD